MNKRKKRTIWILSILTILLVVGAGFAFQNQIREQYWIWKLERCEFRECDEVVEQVVFNLKYDAIPIFLEILEKEVSRGINWEIKPRFYFYSTSGDYYITYQSSGSDSEWQTPNAFIFLKILKAEPEPGFVREVEKFLGDRSDIISSAAAILLYDDLEKIKEFVPLGRITESVWDAAKKE